MRYALAVMLTMTLIGTGMAATDGASSAGLGNNAALRYWTAFALMSAPTPEQDKIIGQWKTAAMDEKTAEIIEQNRHALDYLQLAAEVKPCDWGIVLTGPDTILIYLAKARQITRVACLRARYFFSRGENVDGVRDVRAVLILASQCDSGDSDTLVPLLVKSSIQNAALEAISGYLAGLDAKALKMFTSYLDASPQRPDFAATLRLERQDFLGSYLQPTSGGDLAATQKLLDDLRGENKSVVQPEWKDWIPEGKATPETAQQLSHQLEELDASFQRLIDAAGLPPGEFERRVAVEAKKLAKMRNPFGAFSGLSGLANVRYIGANAETRMLMLRAAAAIVKDGPEKVKDYKDPYGAGPFEYRELPGGFELKSALVVKDKPVTLTVGGR